MNTESSESCKPLKEALFKRIEEEKACPHSRLFHLLQEASVWSIWLVSVLVGALAVAVSVFVVSHRQYALYEATHENVFTFIVEVLPYLWIVTFGLTAYVAVFNIRHTRYGYRYSLSLILGSSLVLSFAGGSALQFFGLGYTIDNILGQQMPMYLSQEKLEQKMWQAPTEGRLVGKQVAKTVAPDRIIIFEDIDGRRWQMNVGELSTRDMKHLSSGKTVRLLGQATNSEFRIFHACGAFPWMINKSVTMRELDEERKVFMEELSDHLQKGEFGQDRQEGEMASPTTTLPASSICAHIAATRRMPAPNR